MTILLGAIADDFTGATDLANTLVKRGMNTLQLIGVPKTAVDLTNIDAVVVALKSRTTPVQQAVDDSLEALHWLQEQNTRQYFFKYCSTFDSTDQGNIGPVADALMNALGVWSCLVCPAFPTNGRTVYQGHLFVGEQLLSDSSMKDHPLTPMRNSNLGELLKPQSSRCSGLVPWSIVSRGEAAIAMEIENLVSSNTGFIIIDATSDQDLDAIGHAAKDHKLITGGSGIALGLPDNFRASGDLADENIITHGDYPGRSFVIAGSCSTATRGQIKYVQDLWPSMKIDLDRVAAGEPIVEETISWALSQSPDSPVLIYGSADPVEVTGIQQRLGRELSGEMMEATLSDIARNLVGRGFDKMVVAGGETSGAIVSALNISSLKIGREIDPGVPWTESSQPELMVALKSGNFGTVDFFEKSLAMLT